MKSNATEHHTNDFRTAQSVPKLSRVWRWCLLLLGWMMLGAFSALSPFIQLPRVRSAGPPPGNLPLRMFFAQWSAWALWLLLAPAAWWLRQRFPLERRARWRSLSAHILAVIVLCLAHAAASQFATQLILQFGAEVPWQVQALRLAVAWVQDLPLGALFYALVLGIGSALDYYRQFRERELRASQLETQLAQAQLQMLKMQLHPHFLFNTLNGITGLVRDNDNAAAVQMLVGLSELLRQTLDSAGKQEVRLSEELEWLELYLKLQQMRFSDRLQISIEAAPDTLDALVPNLITQPLVENSIKHGLQQRAAPGHIAIRAQRVADKLELHVCDDGAGLPSGWQMDTSAGVGLANTTARLRQLFGTNYELVIQNRAPAGVEARLSIPLRQVQPS